MTPNIKVSLLHGSPSSVLQPPPTSELPPIDGISNWVCPASQKSLRTTNPIRSIVDPIVASSLKSGKERGDGKDHISLAVRAQTRQNPWITFAKRIAPPHIHSFVCSWVILLLADTFQRVQLSSTR
jgi:hypothetical protein